MRFMDVVNNEKIKQGEIVPIEIPEQADTESIKPVVDVTDADKFKAICDVLERVWLALTDNMATPLTREQIPDWIETLDWAIKVMPAGYDKQREIIADELRTYQPKRKTK